MRRGRNVGSWGGSCGCDCVVWGEVVRSGGVGGVVWVVFVWGGVCHLVFCGNTGSTEVCSLQSYLTLPKTKGLAPGT